MSILVLGTVALDTIRTPYGIKRQILGGSAVHFAMSARLFAPVHLVSVIGEDFPQRYINFLKQKGIILTSLMRAKGKSFQWRGKYKSDLNTAITLSTELGVLSTFKPQVCRPQSKIKYVFLANLDPDIQRHLLQHLHSPRLIVLDSMNYWIKYKRKALSRLLKKVDIYVANDQEARRLSGETNLIKAAKCLRLLGPRMILIKKGEHGVLFFSPKLIFSLPAYPVEKVIDPTGAGDTFAGGFIGYLAKNKRINNQRIKQALIYGTIAASFNIEGFGVSRMAHLTQQDLEKRIRDFKKCISFK